MKSNKELGIYKIPLAYEGVITSLSSDEVVDVSGLDKSGKLALRLIGAKTGVFKYNRVNTLKETMCTIERLISFKVLGRNHKYFRIQKAV